MATVGTTAGATTTGDTSRCSNCGGVLQILGGTDPKLAADGFEEEYECKSCNQTGGLQYDPETNTTTYTGVCTR